MREQPESAAVFINSNRVHEALLAVVTRAAIGVRAEPILWSADGSMTRPVRLLVSGLSPGERRIPDDAVLAMTRDPALRLLLLCPDELIRPSITLHGGRVMLLGPPHTELRIAARLRIHLANPRLANHRLAAPSVAGQRDLKVVFTEDSTAQAYYGLVGACGGEMSPAALLPVARPVSFGLAFTLRTSVTLDERRGSRVSELLCREEPNAVMERQMLDLVGAEAAVVHFRPGRDWLVHWPKPTAGLFLASPLRLPPAWRLGVGRSSCLVHQPAASGDVLLAVWGGEWAQGSDSSPKEELANLAEAATVGGPRVLDTLVERLERSSLESASALVLEVR